MKEKITITILLFLLVSIPVLSHSTGLNDRLIDKLKNTDKKITFATKSFDYLSSTKILVVKRKPAGEVEEFDGANRYYKKYTRYLQKRYRNDKPIEKPFPVWKHNLQKTYNYSEHRWYDRKLRGTNLRERRLNRLWEEQYEFDFDKF